MKHPISISCLLVFLGVCSFSYGQLDEYNYKREVDGISDPWHKIILPNELFGKTSQDLRDIRVFGITEKNDTIEAPYLLRLTTDKISRKDVAFTLINTSSNEKGYYFTLEIPDKEPINQMELDFGQENFDWRITLEGSQDQREWFRVIENYRILSIKNDQTDFQFTKVTFPSSKYRFFRLLVKSSEKPQLRVASIVQKEVTTGSFRKHKVQKINIKENKQSKVTELDIDLQMPVRASLIEIAVSDTFDYYRPVRLKYLADSFKTEQGWKYNYNTLLKGTLNSMEENEFHFSNTTVQKLKLFIDNQDNQALAIEAIKVKGYEHELITRFTEQADYFLAYGNKNARRANYDIVRFADNIPDELREVELGEELRIEKEEPPVKEPLFKNKIWLWIIMTVIIILLGWFSIKMIRKN